MPDDEFKPMDIYGYCLDRTQYTIPEKIRTYTKHYIMVISELFKDNKVEFDGKQCFKKDGKVFYANDDIWDEYERKAEKEGVQFAVFDEDIEISDEYKFEDFFLVSKERWEELKGKKDIVWQK